MNGTDDIKRSFSEKLDQVRSKHEMALSSEIRKLQVSLSNDFSSQYLQDIETSISRLNGDIFRMRQDEFKVQDHQQALMNMTDTPSLKEIDRIFLEKFNLDNYYPTDKLTYPTIFCETLEEFFKPFIASMNLSEQARQNEMVCLINEARQIAEEKGGGIYGVNFPGQGCYLNGWLFAQKAGIQPSKVSSYPQIIQDVLITAAHEKLGHGFISVYSTLGELKTHLGLSIVEVASRFGLLPADDAGIQLQKRQHALLFTVSQFLEEGWATWIQNYIKEMLFESTTLPQHNMNALLNTIQELPEKTDEDKQIKESLTQALVLVFGEAPVSLDELQGAIKYLAFMGEQLDDFLSKRLHQPLRYVMGELLCMQCELNLGELCVPYAVLIAANITFNPAKVSFSDLSSLLFNDPRLNPDTRLAAISRIKLAQKGKIDELTQRVNDELSLSIPPQIR